MKKGLILLFAFTLGIGAFTSCRKCVTCEANDYSAGIYYSQDYCGTQKQTTDWENSWYDTYPSYMGWSTSCYKK